jgi:predicted Fe-S protein YdhL (DUF1289 family)
MDTSFSPCILVCSIDIKTGYCFGCGRTDAEIAGWADFDGIQRREIADALPARLETIVRKPRKQTKRQRIAQNQLRARSNPGQSA